MPLGAAPCTLTWHAEENSLYSMEKWSKQAYENVEEKINNMEQGLKEQHLRWAKTRVLKTDTRVGMVFGPPLSNGRQRVGAF